MSEAVRGSLYASGWVDDLSTRCMLCPSCRYSLSVTMERRMDKIPLEELPMFIAGVDLPGGRSWWKGSGDYHAQVIVPYLSVRMELGT